VLSPVIERFPAAVTLQIDIQIAVGPLSVARKEPAV
jgi:hypothetical protein